MPVKCFASFQGTRFYILDFKYLLSKLNRITNVKELTRNDVTNLLYYWGPEWPELLEKTSEKS